MNVFRCLMYVCVCVIHCSLNFLIQNSEIPTYMYVRSRRMNDDKHAKNIDEKKTHTKIQETEMKNVCISRNATRCFVRAASIAYALPLLKTVLLFCRVVLPHIRNPDSHYCVCVCVMMLYNVQMYMCLVVVSPYTPHRVHTH